MVRPKAAVAFDPQTPAEKPIILRQLKIKTFLKLVFSETLFAVGK
jgi:hypothetical protein